MTPLTQHQHERKRCFDPVVDERTRLLVLGSLPGDKSLAMQEYYGHRQNKFWELLGAVIGADLRALDYERRLQTLLTHGVGLWDVIAEAKREGSLDTAIRDVTHNGLLELVETLPALKAVAFNGGKAAQLGRRQLGNSTRLALIDLPSSSPAYTLAFETKLAAWKQLRASLSTGGGAR